MLIAAIAASNVLGSLMVEIMLLMPKDIWDKLLLRSQQGFSRLFN
ncbi:MULTISPECIES: hypothetical protein [Photorhabdus]|nr:MULTISPECIES: hypothetical protein [Photorhabdus]